MLGGGRGTNEFSRSDTTVTESDSSVGPSQTLPTLLGGPADQRVMWRPRRLSVGNISGGCSLTANVEQ